MSRRTTDAGPASKTKGPKAIFGRSNDARSVFSDRVRSNFAESASKSFSFSAAPRSTATPCSRNMDAAVVFVPTKSTAIIGDDWCGCSNYGGLGAAVCAMPKRLKRLQAELHEE